MSSFGTLTNEELLLPRERKFTALIEEETNAMPPKMREIYELKGKHILSSREIANKLNLSEHMVYTQTKRVLKHLRVKLGGLCSLLYVLN